MNNKLLLLSTLLCLLALITSIAAIDLTPNQPAINHQLPQSLLTRSSHQQQQCKTPAIYQYLTNFALPLQDVKKLLSIQLSKNEITSFTASDKVTLFSIVSTSKLLSGDQSVSYLTPFKASVLNSQAEFTITYKLNITQGTLPPKNHTFDAVTKITNFSIIYEKEFSTQTGLFTINSANVKIDPNSFVTTFTPSPSDAQKSKFNTAITGASPSLLTEFTKLISNDIVKQSMQTNSKADHLSQVYAESPYKYTFYNNNKTNNIPIDLATSTYTTKESSLTIGMTGQLPSGNSQCTQFVPDFTNTGASLYFSKEFIQNFIEYNINTYPDWKNLKIDKTNMRSPMFQWQLLDLDSIVDGIWNDLADFYQNEIKFSCDIQSQVSTTFDIEKNRLLQVLEWRCYGFVRLNSTYDWKVLDVNIRVNHKTDLKINQGTTSIYVNELETVDMKFNDVASLNGQGKYVVGQSGAKIAGKYIQSLFNDFRTYPIGDRFKVNSNANTIQVEAGGNGIWVI